MLLPKIFPHLNGPAGGGNPPVAPSQPQPGEGGTPAAPQGGEPSSAASGVPGSPAAPTAPAAAQNAAKPSQWAPESKEAYQAWLKAEGLSFDSLPQDRGPASVFSEMMGSITAEQRAAVPFVFKTNVEKRVASILKNKGIDPELPAKFDAASREIAQLKEQLEGFKNKQQETDLPEGFHEWKEDAKKSYLALHNRLAGIENKLGSREKQEESKAKTEAMRAELEEASEASPFTSSSLLSAVILANRDLPQNERMDVMEAALHAQAEQITMVEKALGAGDPAYWELVMKAIPKALESNVPQVNRLMQLALETAHKMQAGAGEGGEQHLGGGAPLSGGQPAEGKSWAEYVQENS